MTAEAHAPGVADATLSSADRKELARRLCRGLYEVWLRRQGSPQEAAPQTNENRAPRPVDARPPANKEKLRAPNTRRPSDSVPHR